MIIQLVLTIVKCAIPETATVQESGKLEIAIGVNTSKILMLSTQGMS